jgi:hypothetical protein
MEACYGGTDVMERSCAMARGKDINMTDGIAMRYDINNNSRRRTFLAVLSSAVPSSLDLD